jgi:hypothetical protein
MTEPVVVALVTVESQTRYAALADVLIVLGASARPAHRCADLLARYPGLTLVLVPDTAGNVIARTRDGAIVVVHRWLPPESVSTEPSAVRDTLTLLGRVRYARWVTELGPTTMVGTWAMWLRGWLVRV